MAASKVQVYVEGVDLWRQAVKAIPQVVRKHLAIAVHETAQMVRQSAISRVARDTGDVARHIEIRGRPTSLTQRVGVRDVDLATRGGRNSFHRNPSVYGTVGLERATKPHRHRKKGTEAQPFLQPARDAGEPWFLAALARRRSDIESELAKFNRGGSGG